jgi:sterol desaturase/sphingolipid hydroxylase (fatty acid hydroxylase superfamily)
MLGMVLALSIWEFFFPAQKLVRSRLWWVRVALLQALTMLIMWAGAGALRGQLLKLRLFDGESLFTPVIGGVVSYLAGTFVFYWWHRLRHESSFFWRTMHQIHHSPSRIQAVTAFYVHPVEALASSAVNGGLVLVIFGLGVEALLWNALLAALVGIFYHTNMNTPRWVGFFLQRPEMHRYHHKAGVHAFNYGDIPVWDMLFGTYHNPRTCVTDYGFGGERELGLGQMLLFQDVNQVHPEDLKLSS